MDAILVDTDVFSFLMKGTDTRAELYKPHVKGKTIALSFITVGELFAWGVRRNWGPKKFADLEQRIKTAVVVPYDLDLCRQFGRIKAELLKAGNPVAANDLWIAACALRHSIPLVTHNAKHFTRIPGLIVVTESERPKAPSNTKLFEDPPVDGKE
jgi:tRNA(fMet)-specific endonuclease VapC